jgi:hypothetical protein
VRELLLRVETPQININGHRFDLRLSDLELFTRAQALFERYERFTDTPHPPREVLEAAREVAALLEEALGEGALMKISDGRPVSLALAMEWLAALAQEAANNCLAEALNDEEPSDGQ